jgi:F0F1-type ATP synthase membrane subunit b/b'
MGFIKKSWKWIVGIIGFFIGLVWVMNTNSSKKVKKIKKDIRSNENKTSEVDGKIKYIKKKKKKTKKNITTTNQELKNIKKKKPKIKKKTGKQATKDIKNRLKNN